MGNGTTVPEKYKPDIDILSEGLSGSYSIVSSRRNVEVLLIFSR